MDHPKLPIFFDYTIYTLLFFGLLYVFVLDTTNDNKLFHTSSTSSSKLYEMKIYRDDLEEALAGASTEKKTVIITIVNKAYVEGDNKAMLDLFLDGFWNGDDTRQLVNHLLIVAMDNTSYERCKFLRLHCYKLETSGTLEFVGEKIYLSADFIKMMWRRTQFLCDVLKRGYNFVFTDTDVLWLRNPFTNLSLNGNIDLQISTDKFNGKRWSKENPINTGFYMIRSNNKTIQLLDAWYARKNNSSGLKEQDVLQNMIHEGILGNLSIKVEFLNTIYFSGFCQDSKNVRVVKTVHANCCRSITAKLTDLTAVIHDWKRYKRISANETRVSSFRWFNHVACRNSWLR